MNLLFTLTHNGDSETLAIELEYAIEQLREGKVAGENWHLQRLPD